MTDNNDQFGQIVTPNPVQPGDKMYGLVIRNGEPVAVPVEKLPKNHWTSKTRKRAKFAETQVESLGVEKFADDPAPKKTRAKKTTTKQKAPTKKVARKEKSMSDGTVTMPVKAKKTPKFVPEWMEIREAIRDGRKLKEIAAQYNVRYYDVYRVKVHGMDL